MQHREIVERFGKYKFIKKIGEGAFAMIALCQNQKTKENVAIKVINRKHVLENGILEYLERELKLIGRINHPSFPKYHEIIYNEDSILIVMEYMPNGNLIELVNSGVNFSMSDKLNILYKIASGINYLHERGISHRDIKAENIVFDSDYQPKIIDFGLAHEKECHLKTFCGTPNYIAPEVITAHVLLTKKFPFEFKSEAKFIKEIMTNSLKIQNLCYGEMHDLINDCLVIEPERRLTSKQIVAKLDEIISKRNIFLTMSGRITIPKMIRLDIFNRCNTDKFLEYSLEQGDLIYLGRVLTIIHKINVCI
ncbi:CAMK family protein kinase [Trichomonas vaginalis G3]|uniref:CAMK family protein kinase n=1 Tax=Trichomonas vaginalis (strain ATCC PRA-98 / G3) TaxID=412133 RepID=A2DKY4_TRIV3|nr:protein serine/threonine kinase protein [Trichomonas vaginalis G3]EAY18937.1 CAMK family protein kinase [Trichomonas vaginalis G3]KAI5532003.1 protein serine/threonine kinase protein [Trichomonas vaginalis G3]|eukprot:XP_001579923.1 CAMK family protein kinase [Trichomonas vaginalis G3]